MNRRIGCLTFILFLAAGTFCGFASADSVTIGTNTGTNVFPFGLPTYAGEYQQVYNGSLFSGPVDVTGITFFSAGGTIGGDFTIDLSTTSAGISSLSTIYANNIGANNTQFFSGSVSNVLSFTGGPFLYNPSSGNLLLDVNVITANPGPAFLGAGCSADTNRVFNFGGNGPATIGNSTACPSSPTSYGLQTEFTVTPATSAVPEPPSLPLFAMALFAIIGALKKLRPAA